MVSADNQTTDNTVMAGLMAALFTALISPVHNLAAMARIRWPPCSGFRGHHPPDSPAAMHRIGHPIDVTVWLRQLVSGPLRR